jgi:protein-S-isoprenylcysteine O-methyltransferase Ste14
MALFKTTIFTVLVPGTVMVVVPWLVLRFGWELAVLPVGLARWAGPVPIAVGALGYLTCALDFAITGEGTPAPIDPPRTLVTRGFYRLVRNPMYLSVLSVLIGEAMLFGSATLLAFGMALAVVFHLFVVLVEEPGLRARFGTAYEEYCRRVPRWVPRVGVLRRDA